MHNIIHILASRPEFALGIGDPVILSIQAAAADPLPDSFVWMPAGKHAITAGTMDGDGFQGEITCDEQSYRSVAASFQKIIAGGQRVWLDLNHDDAAAAAWIKSFSWDPAKGIIAHVEWTSRGESALRGKEYYSFSPAFAADGKTGRVVGLMRGHAAGGLVNAPAFGSAMPSLIAARLGSVQVNKTAPGGKPENTDTMNKEILIKLLAALKVTAPADASEDVLIALVAKNLPDTAGLSSEIAALKASLDAATAQNLAQVQAKQATDAKIAALEQKQTELLATLAGVQARVEVTQADPVDVLAAYAAKDPAQIPASDKFAIQRAELALERGVIFARDIAPRIRKDGKDKFSQRGGLMDVVSLAEKRSADIIRIAAKNVNGPIRILAANSLGTLSGSLIAQQSLSLLKAELPALSSFTTDFSNAAAKLNQTIITRTRAIPTVSSYVPATGYAAVAATDTDVPVTINQHRYVQFDYNANELASTGRDLFGEQAEGAVYALGKDVVDALMALFTTANYALGAQKTVVTSANWNRVAFLNARAALVLRHVYPRGGFALQNATYFAALSQDPSIVSLAVFQKPEVITEGQLPAISGITPIEYADFPANGINLAAVVGTREAAVVATRLPYDYVDAQVGSNYGAVSQITDPNTGLSVMLTQYVNHDAGVSRYRVALMSGTAVGDTTRAQLITSA